MNGDVLVVVEDDPDLLEGWKDLFELSGYQVYCFSSGRAALSDSEALAQADVLITDYHLADINGIELIRKARRINPTLPATVLTGLKQEKVTAAISAEPNVTLFYKPAAMLEIERHVETLLARKRA